MPRKTKDLVGGGLLCLGLWLLSAGCAAPPRRRITPILHPSVAHLNEGLALEGSYLVSFRPQVQESRLESDHFDTQVAADPPQLLKSADDRIASWRFLTTVDFSGAESGPQVESPPLGMSQDEESRNFDDSPRDSVGSLFQVDFDSMERAQEVLSEWEAEEAILFAEPNYISHLSQSPRDGSHPDYKALAADYRVAKDWWLQRLAIPEAFDVLASRSAGADNQDSMHSPVIALLDSGVDYEHPALKKNIWTNSQMGVVGCDDDRHGCNPSLPQASRRGRIGTGEVWPFGLRGPGQSCLGQGAYCAHGTHVAGIIVGDPTWEPTTGDGPIRGLCPVCRIMVLRVVSKIGAQVGILDSSILAALKYISLFRDKEGQPLVRLVNASFGKFARSYSVSAVIRNLRHQRGILLIGAAGNEGSMRREYPAAYDDAIAVAATDVDDRKGPYSNFGPWIDLSAPGQLIRSTTPGSGTDRKSGTSMATPMVTAIAGMMLAYDPTISVGELERRLFAAADPRLYQSSPDPTMTASSENGSIFYPKLRHTKAQVPLLGAGIINAAYAVRNQPYENPPLYRGGDRVTPGCSTISTKGLESKTGFSQTHALLARLLWFLPLGGILLQAGRKYWLRSTSANS